MTPSDLWDKLQRGHGGWTMEEQHWSTPPVILPFPLPEDSQILPRQRVAPKSQPLYFPSRPKRDGRWLLTLCRVLHSLWGWQKVSVYSDTDVHSEISKPTVWDLGHANPCVRLCSRPWKTRATRFTPLRSDSTTTCRKTAPLLSPALPGAINRQREH